MLDLASGIYSYKQVDDTLHFKNGSRYIGFRYALLNYDDVEIGNLTVEPGGTVTFDSLAEIMRRGVFIVKEGELKDIDWLNDRIKPYFRLHMPNRSIIEWPLGVLMISAPSRQEDNNTVLRQIETFDANQILKQDKFITRPLYIAGSKYTDIIQDIIEGAGMWKINITPSSATLGIEKSFDPGTEKLTVVNTLLTEINYTPLWVDENGYAIAGPYVIPADRETEYTYKTDQLSIICPGSLQEEDVFDIPNTWAITASNPEKTAVTGTYVNDLPVSPTSTVNRRRSIVSFKTINDIYDQATLDNYTKRVAYEESQIYGLFKFNTATMPHHSYQNILFIDHDRLDVMSKYTETKWELELSDEGVMSHECRRVIIV